ncbi:hypothetical protein I2I05_04785 [Hymenobacter sp. BT683]|uniref:Uncharacterized protein n=1 Tax=Hymenobacter jeongseonensis TaxID=2791027 RepID=A0ABS0IEC0_9BACT|nr:hypothetical protein [Hymenobacter jeongseonensis]MBF9236703.1 hypothetical protein [Hymenobacter jeongseonensis]
MNSTFILLILAAGLGGVNNAMNTANTPAHANQTGQIKAEKPIWIDKHNGRRYPLPNSVGGKPASFYLNNPKVSPLAKALYKSLFRPSDNDSTTQLLALVTTKNQEIRPFYRWCLDFTIAISDGALGEYPGKPALAYATTFPLEFFDYMDKDPSGQRYKRWVEIIAYSGLDNYDKAHPKIIETISADMTAKCQSCNSTTRARIKSFAKSVAAAAISQ